MKLLNNAPNLPLYDAVYRLYPYKSFLAKEGMASVEDTLQNFQLNYQSSTLSKIEQKNRQNGNLDVMVGNQSHQIVVPMGNRRDFQDSKTGKYVN